MSVEHLHRTSHAIKDRPDVWWYEESGGICLVVEHPDRPSSTQVLIPWRAIRRALERLDRSPDHVSTGKEKR